MPTFAETMKKTRKPAPKKPGAMTKAQAMEKARLTAYANAKKRREARTVEEENARKVKAREQNRKSVVKYQRSTRPLSR